MALNNIKGGHTFPRRSGAKRRTVVPTISFDTDRTKRLLRNCKAHGVSISSALFSLCNIAWAKTSGENWELPTWVIFPPLHTLFALICSIYVQNDVLGLESTAISYIQQRVKRLVLVFGNWLLQRRPTRLPPDIQWSFRYFLASCTGR